MTVGPSKSQYRPKETLESTSNTYSSLLVSADNVAEDDDPNSAYGEEVSYCHAFPSDRSKHQQLLLTVFKANVELQGWLLRHN